MNALTQLAQRAVQRLHGSPRPAPGLPLRPRRPALFIDKDGTLVENVPYNVDPALLRLMPGVGEALAALAGAGFALVLVTNQSGLAHGYFSRADFARLQAVLAQRLYEAAGITLLDMMVCPHAPGLDGGPACLCRKPAPGMLLGAARKHGLDLADSWMVGDTLDDVEAGHRAGTRTVLFDSGGETLWRQSPLRQPDLRCTQWPEVAARVLAVTAAATAAFGLPGTATATATPRPSTGGDRPEAPA